MIRLLAGVIAVFGITTSGLATSYADLSLPDLVARADVIVVGEVVAAGPRCRVRVARTLAGTARREVEFLRHPDTTLPAGEARVFFLTDGPKGLTLVYPLAVRSADHAQAVRRLVDMRANPGPYLADRTIADDPDFLETLGWAFADREKIGALDRSGAIAHLRRALSRPESRAVVTAVVALRRVGSKDAGAVIPLLHHRDEAVKRAALHFLAGAPDKAAVGPLCDVLDGLTGGSALEEPLGRALIAINDPSAVPALERAARRGIDGATSWALGRLGDTRSMDVLMAGVDRDSMDALEGVMVMVRRSNKRFEPWMAENRWSPATGLERKGDWRRWWEANKAGFKVVRSAEEAFGGGR